MTVHATRNEYGVSHRKKLKDRIFDIVFGNVMKSKSFVFISAFIVCLFVCDHIFYIDKYFI